MNYFCKRCDAQLPNPQSKSGLCKKCSASIRGKVSGLKSPSLHLIKKHFDKTELEQPKIEKPRKDKKNDDIS